MVTSPKQTIKTPHVKDWFFYRRTYLSLNPNKYLTINFI